MKLEDQKFGMQSPISFCGGGSGGGASEGGVFGGNANGNPNNTSEGNDRPGHPR